MATKTVAATLTQHHKDFNGDSDQRDIPVESADEAAINYYERTAGKLNLDKTTRSIYLNENNLVGAVNLPITDIRSNIQDYQLDVHGFQIVRHENFLRNSSDTNSELSDNYVNGNRVVMHETRGLPARDPWWSSKSNVYARYYPTITELVQKQLGISSVLWKNFLLRDEPACTTDANAFMRRRRGPITRPHIDWSSRGIRAMLRNILPTFYDDTERTQFMAQEDIARFFAMRDKVIEAEDRCAKLAGCNSVDDWDGKNYNGPRWGMINVWQPLEGPVRRDPLAWMDVRTAVPDEDYEGVPRWYEVYKGFTFGFEAQNWIIRPPPVEAEELDENGKRKRHAWHWISGQQKEEVTLLKIFDSEAEREGGRVAGGCPHTAITIAGTEELPPRKSIEVKGFIFW